MNLLKFLQKRTNYNNITKPTYRPPEPERTIYITGSALNKIKALVKHCDVEIAWHGTVKTVDDKLIITNILVPPQNVTSVTATSDDAEYIEWLNNLPDKEFNSLRFHGHSHVNMSVSPSGTDTSYRNKLMANMPNSTYIFMIINKKHEYSLEIREQRKIFTNIKLKVTNNYDSWALNEIKKKVKKESLTHKTTYSQQDWDDFLKQFEISQMCDDSRGGYPYES